MSLPPRSHLLTLSVLVASVVALGATAAWAEKAPAARPKDKVGVEEKLGVTLPAGLMFKDEAGNTVEFTKLIQRPTVLTLVYFKCPSICTPLLNEVAHTVDEIDNVRPGKHYDLITVSFDPSEGAELAKTGKTNLLGRMETKVPPEAWRFLTGEEAMIRRLADTVGFYYKRTDDGADFLHTGSVIFLSKDAKVMRYLNVRDSDGDGELEMLPFDMEMAINDATSGKTRSLMQRIQQLCYRAKPDGQGYVLDVTQIVLWVTLLGAAVFFALVLFLKRRRAPAAPKNPSVADHAAEGGTA